MLSASASADDRLTVSGNMDIRFLFLENYSQYDRHYTDAYLPTYSKPGYELDAETGEIKEKEVKRTAPAVAGQRGDEDSISWAHQRFNFRTSILGLV
jgi:hypothetical protein